MNTLKPKIVTYRDMPEWIVDALSPSFHFELYDHNAQYTKADILWYEDFSFSNNNANKINWPGRRVVDKCYEAYPFDDACYIDNTGSMHLTAKDFIRFTTCFEWNSRNYNNFIASTDKKSYFLLALMNYQRPHRDWLFRNTTEYHSNSLISYAANNKFINGDIDSTDPGWQNHINAEWYNKTYFSFVAETYETGKTFVSEKIYKPLAFGHPFLLCGTPNTLKLLHDQGFESYSAIIDEKYDQEENNLMRRTLLLNELKHLYKNTDLFFDPKVIEITRYNHYHFFNTDLCTELCREQIIEPFLNFYESP